MAFGTNKSRETEVGFGTWIALLVLLFSVSLPVGADHSPGHNNNPNEDPVGDSRNKCLARLNAAAGNSDAVAKVCQDNTCNWFGFDSCAPRRVTQLPPVDIGGHITAPPSNGPEVHPNPVVKNVVNRPVQQNISNPQAQIVRQPSNAGQTVPEQATAIGDSNADLRSCQALAQEADRCCSDPASCGATEPNLSQSLNSSGGLTDTCKQMQKSGRSVGNSNSRGADVCLARYTTCVTSCSTLAANYGGDANVSNTLRAQARRCSGYSSRVSELLQQSESSLAAAKGGANCEVAGGASPQSLGNGGAGGSGRSSGAGINPQQDQASANSQNGNAQGEDGYATPNASGGSARGQFNLPDNRDAFQPDQSFGSHTTEQASSSPAIQVRPPANNTGGSVPGQDGSATIAKLGSSGRGSSPGDPGFRPENLEQGFRSGGYSQQSGGYAGASDPGSDFGGAGARQQGRASGPSPYPVGMDLKQYLPGGRLDPSGRIGGQKPGKQIHGSFVSLWFRISDRIREKCRAGQLRDC